MNNLKKCSRCVTPETHETIIFDENNICNVCNNQTIKNNLNWDKKKIELLEIVSKYKNKNKYDCIVPFSGGKDSTWTLYYIVKHLNLNPLVVRFDHGFLRPNLERNTKNTIEKLKVDFLNHTPAWELSRKLMLQSFLEKGDFCWHCHTGIFSYPMWVAIEKKIPLIIWGEPSAEYTAYYSYDQQEEVDEKRFNRYINLGITAEDMLIRLEGLVNEDDLKFFSYPPINDLKKINYKSICLGSFIKWDTKKQSDIIMKELDWKGDEVENVPNNYNYEKIECYMQGVRDYIKYIKRGYSRVSHLTSIDIRNKRLSRDRALEIVNEFEGKRPPSLDIFLQYVGLSENEFNDILAEHMVYPYSHNFSNVEIGKKTNDYDKWKIKDKMPEHEAKTLLNRWKRRKI